MKLEEFMREENLSESDIIEAARVVNALCRSLTACKICPLNNGSRCIATRTGGVNIVGIIKERMKELLRPNYMEKVAGILGLKFSKPFIVRSKNNEDFHCYLGKEGLKLACDRDADCRKLLGDLLVGKAYIMNEEEND